MEDLRSKSYTDGRMQVESYGYDGDSQRPAQTPMGLQDLRCYSASYASSSSYSSANHPPPPQQQQTRSKDAKLKKGKSANGSVSKSWSFSDPELQRKKRVASYKTYAVEGKVKGSFRKSFRWLKDSDATLEAAPGARQPWPWQAHSHMAGLRGCPFKATQLDLHEATPNDPRAGSRGCFLQGPPRSSLLACGFYWPLVVDLPSVARSSQLSYVDLFINLFFDVFLRQV
ncbi:uncharacterized protein LOC127806572 [Diospyros lotus]|uniref:uncharacterized protein LOC127806572 n=1 Tax=Diospyros lotus TaxID=55363 RepID=UPI00225794EA|nr:uncharacterized protein LOC127806572 [Diospyros lotus]